MASGRPSRLVPRRVQRPSPNDPRNGSKGRALTALLESWVNDSRGSALPRGSAVATPSKRRAALASSTTTAHNGSGVPCSEYPLRPPLAPQASRNTYQIGLHRGSKNERSTTILAALRKEIERRPDARLELRLEAALPAQPRWQLCHASGSGTRPRSHRRPARRN